MNCIVCDVPIVDANDSEEHVAANAIGGRLKVRASFAVFAMEQRATHGIRGPKLGVRPWKPKGEILE